MGRRAADEFPLLRPLGLYAAPIEGNGNCLFNALSDQVNGDQSQHAEIRTRVVNYMRDHGDFYKAFVDVHPGAGAGSIGVRRNPKRKNAGTYSSSAAHRPAPAPPTEEEIERAFEQYLARMAQGGVFGDNMEIVAFSAAYNVDVKIYQRENALVVSGSGDQEHKDLTKSPRQVAHIAYHDWEHYSSIRNLDGPHAGLPHVQERHLSAEDSAAVRAAHAALQSATVIDPWKIKSVETSLPHLNLDHATIQRMLVRHGGSVDAAVTELLEGDGSASSSSSSSASVTSSYASVGTPGSSSVERDVDSDDDKDGGPAGSRSHAYKRQDRRLSRATKARVQALQHEVSVRGGGSDLPHRPKRGVNGSRDMTAPASPLPLKLETSSDLASMEPSVGDIPPEADIKQPVKSVRSSTLSAPLHARTVPGPRRVTARDRRNLKKLAQKAAAKERKTMAATGTGGRKARPQALGTAAASSIDAPISSSLDRDSPAMYLKTLYI